MKETIKKLVRGETQNSREAIQRINFRSGLGDSAWAIYGLVRSMKPQVCVEIGTARGYSACMIGLALKENGQGKLYAIDPHRPTEWNDSESVDSLEILRTNLETANVSPWVEVMRATSDQAAKDWNKPIDLLFIDGDHSYEGVKRDWNLFSPHVASFGVAIFHDTLWGLSPPEEVRSDMGVPQFVEELRVAGYPVLTIAKDFGVSLVQPKIRGEPLQR